MLEIQNIKKYFGGIRAIDNCSFKVKPGLITTLIGPNGAGKSTIFNLISGIIRADSGRIIFENKNINNLSPEIISNLGISRLFQQSRLFDNLTVKDNLLLALDNNDTKFFKNLVGLNKLNQNKEQIIKQALIEINMSKFLNRQAKELSYGQKRLVEIQRTILNPHNFLMLDEPASGVSLKLRQNIIKILKKEKKSNKIILLIEHNMDFTFKVSDWIIVMDKGKILIEGQPENIKNNKKVLEIYLGK